MSAKNNEKSIDKKEDKSIELAQDRPVFRPETDIYEDKTSITVVCDMPGVTQDKIDITLENDVLSITGEQCCCCEPESHELLHRGYNTGIYRRAFTVLSDIDKSKISAKINNGILKVVLPKQEKTPPKKITVETE